MSRHRTSCFYGLVVDHRQLDAASVRKVRYTNVSFVTVLVCIISLLYLACKFVASKVEVGRMYLSE